MSTLAIGYYSSSPILIHCINSLHWCIMRMEESCMIHMARLWKSVSGRVVNTYFLFICKNLDWTYMVNWCITIGRFVLPLLLSHLFLVCLKDYLLISFPNVFLFQFLKQHITHAAQASSAVRTVVASSLLGSVTTKMIVVMVQMKKVVNILHVRRENSHVPIIAASLCHRFVIVHHQPQLLHKHGWGGGIL